MSRNAITPDVRLRPLRVPDDYPALTAANQAARSAAGRPSSITVADLTRYLEHQVNCDPERGFVVAERDGRVCGYGIVFWRDLVEGGRIVVGHGILDPDARTEETTATLFGWLDERLAVVGAGLTDPRPEYASAFTWVDNARASAFLAGRGWSVVARAYEMLRHSLDDIPKRRVPDGLDIRPVGHADAPRVWDALVDGFRDHRHKPEATDEDRERFLDNPVHDPSLWVIAFDGDEIAGGVVNIVDLEENAETGNRRGYVEAVFTRPAWRRRGLARALVAESLVRLRDRGMTSALLGVDGANPNQAMTLYEDIGFEIAATELEWRRPLTAGGGPR
jgi:ribosomal protein S18 acetylase RimI-like enzyme